MYTKEDDLSKLLGFFSLVSLGLCCMGLFAIFSLHLLQKTKELSIRKVLGANAFHLIRTTTKSYVALTVLAIGVAIPVAWYIMDNWLTGFSYRIAMDALVFIGSAALILLMSGTTLLYHILKSLRVNPVESLKSE
jgi:putative ABC transport system permease protein